MSLWYVVAMLLSVENRASRDFSTFKSSGLSSFEVGRVAATQCLLCRHWIAFAV